MAEGSVLASLLTGAALHPPFLVQPVLRRRGQQQIILPVPQSAKPRAADNGGPALRWRRAPPARSPAARPAACGSQRPGRTGPAATQGRNGCGWGGAGGAAGGRAGRAAGGGAGGLRGAGPQAVRARRRGSVRRNAGRASLCSLRQPQMGEVEPGPAGPLEPPEPPEAPASRRPGGIRVLKVRWAGGLGRERKRAEAAPTPRGGRGSRRPPPRVGQSALRLSRSQNPAGGAAAPAEASAAGPRRGRGRLRPHRCPSLAACHPPRRPTPWGRRPPGRRRHSAPLGPRGPSLPPPVAHGAPRPAAPGPTAELIVRRAFSPDT